MKTSPESNSVNAGHRHQSWNFHYVRLMPYNYSHSKCVSKHTLYYGLGLELFRKSGVLNKMLVAGRQIIGHKEHSQKHLSSPGNKHDGKCFEVEKMTPPQVSAWRKKLRSILDKYFVCLQLIIWLFVCCYFQHCLLNWRDGASVDIKTACLPHFLSRYDTGLSVWQSGLSISGKM